MDILKIIKLLKDDILQIQNEDIYAEISVSTDDFSKMSLVVERVSEEMSEKELKKFNDKYFNVFSILNRSMNAIEMHTIILERYVVYQKEMASERIVSFEEVIMRVFNPLIKFFERNDFEIKIKKVAPYIPATINSDLTNYYLQLEDLENSLEEKSYVDVCTKSTALLQSLFKEILNHYRASYNDNDSFNNLYTEVRKQLNLNQEEYSNKHGGKELRSLKGEVDPVADRDDEYKNIYSSSYDMLSQEMGALNNLPHHHYKLMVDKTKTLCNFLLGTLDYQDSKKRAAIK